MANVQINKLDWNATRRKMANNVWRPGALCEYAIKQYVREHSLQRDDSIVIFYGALDSVFLQCSRWTLCNCWFYHATHIIIFPGSFLHVQIFTYHLREFIEINAERMHQSALFNYRIANPTSCARIMRASAIYNNKKETKRNQSIVLDASVFVQSKYSFVHLCVYALWTVYWIVLKCAAWQLNIRIKLDEVKFDNFHSPLQVYRFVTSQRSADTSINRSVPNRAWKKNHKICDRQHAPIRPSSNHT